MKATYNTIDWEQRRYELAKSAMNGILSDENEKYSRLSSLQNHG